MKIKRIMDGVIGRFEVRRENVFEREDDFCFLGS